MRRVSLVWMMVGLLGAAGMGLAAPAAADEPCGEKGQKSCPLQGWMEENVQKPLESGDLKKVAAALEKAAAFAPDKKWDEGDSGWSATAKKGVAAAKAGDEKATKKTCKSCHKAFRKEYKAKYRKRPVPK